MLMLAAMQLEPSMTAIDPYSVLTSNVRLCCFVICYTMHRPLLISPQTTVIVLPYSQEEPSEASC